MTDCATTGCPHPAITTAPDGLPACRYCLADWDTGTIESPVLPAHNEGSDAQSTDTEGNDGSDVCSTDFARQLERCVPGLAARQLAQLDADNLLTIDRQPHTAGAATEEDRRRFVSGR